MLGPCWLIRVFWVLVESYEYTRSLLTSTSMLSILGPCWLVQVCSVLVDSYEYARSLLAHSICLVLVDSYEYARSLLARTSMLGPCWLIRVCPVLVDSYAYARSLLAYTSILGPCWLVQVCSVLVDSYEYARSLLARTNVTDITGRTPDYVQFTLLYEAERNKQPQLTRISCKEQQPLVSLQLDARCQMGRGRSSHTLGPTLIDPTNLFRIARGKGNEPTFTWRKSGKPFRKNYPSSHDEDSNLTLPVLSSLAQHEVSALANFATEAVEAKQSESCWLQTRSKEKVRTLAVIMISWWQSRSERVTSHGRLFTSNMLHLAGTSQVLRDLVSVAPS
uniref:Uncharacterized protein n=1 Tax=Timema cristinae TaxID=61476 RepID=A0A7R9D6A1_TIMCR|nr:unnamed protein product [Timema cristinae]